MGRAEHFQQGASEHTFPPLYHGSTPTPSAGPAPTPNSSGPSVLPSAFSTAGNVVKATTGVTDFSQAKQSFSKGNVLGGIGHSIMGAINAGSTAAMVVPFFGEGVKAADIGLNLAVKGGDMFKAADTVKAVDTAKTTHLNPSQFHGPDLPPLYHGSGQMMKPGTVIKPGNEGMTFATPHRDTAASFANSNAGHTVENQVGETSASWKQPGMFNPVYKVKPASDTKLGTYGNPHYATSQKGFEVGKIHSWTSEGEKLTPPPHVLARANTPRKSGID